MTDEERAEAHALGLTDEQLDYSFGQAGDDDEAVAETVFELWPENEPSLLWLLRLTTQWHADFVMGVGKIYTGLRYETAVLLMREAGLKRAERNALIADLQRMELAALPILNESK